MTHRTAKEQGFTTVELLISLFIAAAFIATGFQLFSVVTKDSGEAQMRAKAASIVNTTLQERSGIVGSVCTPTPASDSFDVPATELPQAEATVSFSCPYGDGSTTTRVNVVVTYGNPQESIEGSLDVTQ